LLLALTPLSAVALSISAFIPAVTVSMLLLLMVMHCSSCLLFKWSRWQQRDVGVVFKTHRRCAA
jgi:hypothetical protein